MEGFDETRAKLVGSQESENVGIYSAFETKFVLIPDLEYGLENIIFIC